MHPLIAVQLAGQFVTFSEWQEANTQHIFYYGHSKNHCGRSQHGSNIISEKNAKIIYIYKPGEQVKVGTRKNINQPIKH